VAGVPVSLGSVQATTGADGSYALTYTGTMPDTTLQIHAERLKGSASYAGFSTSLDQLTSQTFYPGYNNVISRPIYLVPLDTVGAVTVNPKKDITVSSSTTPGVSLLIPAGSLRDQNGNLYAGKISLSVVSADHTPVPLPAGDDPSMAIMIEP